MKRITLAIGLAGGALLGEAAWQGDVRAQAVQTPMGWATIQIPVSYRLTELSGDLPHLPEAWSLDFKQEIRPKPEFTGTGPASVSGTIILPEDGQIELWASAPPIDPHTGKREVWPGGFALILERIEEPSSSVYLTRQDGRSRLTCSNDLEAPGDLPIRAMIQPTDSGVDVQVGDSHASCSGTVGDFSPAIVPGLRRVAIGDIEVGGKPTPNPDRIPRALWWIGGALFSLFGVGLELFSGARAALVALSTAPLLGAGWLAGMDLQLWAETARVTWMPIAWLPALFPLWAALVLKLFHHLGRSLKEKPHWSSGRDWTRAAVVAAGLPLIHGWATASGQLHFALCIGLGILGCGGMAWALPLVLQWLGSVKPVRASALTLSTATLFSLLMAWTIPNHRMAVLLMGFMGLTLSGLVWANANASKARLYNLTCLVLMSGSIALAEGAIRYTKAGNLWAGRGGTVKEDDIYGWVKQANQDFECFDAGVYTDYPTECFPARPDAEDGRLRIIAMGGSSTAGAWQNDDIREFYPARLEELLAGQAQVINQGVGGWTTFQIHHYLLDNLQVLQPDVLTFYVGHNDLLTSVPMPYSELYSAWQQGSQKRLSDTLREVRLYQAMRYLLTSLRPADRRVAVPTEDARLMLTEIIELMAKQGGTVILASEGLDPSPGPLAEYNSMLKELAELHSNVQYADTANLLHESTDDAFFDDCHLKEAGHEIVADALYEEIKATGILGP